MSSIPALSIQPATSGRLVAVDGRELVLRSTRLRATAGAGLARVRVEQVFANPYAEPLAVTYQLPLPADGAVSGFAFRLGDQRIVGEIDRRAAARARFEEAVVAGHSAALLEQDRSSLFTQEIGNVPPGVEIGAEVDVDQPLAWIEGGAWEWRFPTTVAPRYLGHVGRVADADKLGVDIAAGAVPPRLQLELDVGDDLAAGGAPSSPSHEIVCRDRLDGPRVGVTEVGLAGEAAALDRDVVVRWPVATSEVAAVLGVARSAEGPLAQHAYGALTLVPPASAVEPSVARDVVVLLDTSGSMSGEPLEQAKAVVAALLDTLSDRDHLEMIEFSTRPRRWKRHAVAMGPRQRADAHRWLAGLRASGGTEMHSAVLEAARSQGSESQRQVVLVSDGLIGFEQEIVRAVLDGTPAASRFHVVGVGSAPNRSLTQAAARAGRGVEVIVGLGEDPVLAARRLLARTSAPAVVDLQVSGSALVGVAPMQLPDLFAGAPARLALQLRPQGGALAVRGRTATGVWEQQLHVAAVAPGAGRPELVALFGRERVEDLETQVAAGGSADAEIEACGLQFGLATRLTSWVAVTESATVDPTSPTRRERVPHELAQGLSVEGLGLRAAEAAAVPMAATCAMPAPPGRASRRRRAESLEDLVSRSGAAGAPPEPSPAMDRAQAKAQADGRDSEASDDAERPAPFDGGARQLEAVVKAWADGRLVLELGWDGGDWRCPSAVRVRWADGTEALFDVDVAHSTAAGDVASGLVVRLTLLVGEPAPQATPPAASPVQVRWTGEDGDTVVELRRS